MSQSRNHRGHVIALRLDLDPKKFGRLNGASTSLNGPAPWDRCIPIAEVHMRASGADLHTSIVPGLARRLEAQYPYTTLLTITPAVGRDRHNVNVDQTFLQFAFGELRAEIVDWITRQDFTGDPNHEVQRLAYRSVTLHTPRRTDLREPTGSMDGDVRCSLNNFSIGVLGQQLLPCVAKNSAAA